MTDGQSSAGGVAVVLGGSIAGLLAAQALTEAYGEVIVCDRDALRTETSSEPRRGVPQGRHAHGLLAAGREAIEELLPGATGELVAAGVPTGDVLGDLRFFTMGRRLKQTPIGLTGLAASRPFLESYVRRRLAAHPGVRLRERTEVVGLEASDDRTRVTGVRVRPLAEGAAEESLAADLVVDATGRGSRTPHRIAELGYDEPVEERVGVDLAYVTRHYRREPGMLDGDVAVILGPTQDSLRGAFVQVVEGDRFVVTLFGLLGDHPPTDDQGYRNFAKSLSRPDVHEVVEAAEPLDDPVLHRFPYSVRRRYERLRRFPAGLLVVGDAVCSFNPLYGQGMSVAALQARVLRRQLAGGAAPDSKRFFSDIRPVVDAPWQMAAGADLAFPGVEGRRTAVNGLVNRYMARLQAAAEHDASVARTFTRVSNLLDPPSRLMRPDMALRALVGGGSRT